ncbi:MAG: hypothetical protein KME50_26460 [Nostoc desertorum CM1-VF14]|nr:hypothetical protein [Nostoc desertorum CM1-VF14]
MSSAIYIFRVPIRDRLFFRFELWDLLLACCSNSRQQQITVSSICNL